MSVDYDLDELRRARRTLPENDFAPTGNPMGATSDRMAPAYGGSTALSPGHMTQCDAVHHGTW